MKVTDLCPGGFASCCYLVTQGADAVLIDCSAPVSTVTAALRKRGAHLHAILCTHGHFDHLLTADALREELHVPLYLHSEDAGMPANGQQNGFALFFGFDRTWRPADRTFGDGDKLSFGSLSFQVMHTPGHSRGSCTFLAEHAAFTGDTLFMEGYGRTDLYGGDFGELRSSLQRLCHLQADLTVYPGHGESGPLALAIQSFRQ